MAGSLEYEFKLAMVDIYNRAKNEAGYTASIFNNMIYERGALSTAKFLINASNVSDGYTELFKRNRLDLTVEALVLENPKWHPLFTESDLARCRKRLKEYRYEPRELKRLSCLE